MKRKKQSPYKIYGLIAIISIVAVGVYLAYIGVIWWAAYLLAVNAITFLLFGFDKAISSGRVVRVPERVLYILAFFGASPALLLGQKLFRHKTIKTSFQIIFWLIITMQIMIIAYVLYGDILKF